MLKERWRPSRGAVRNWSIWSYSVPRWRARTSSSESCRGSTPRGVSFPPPTILRPYQGQRASARSPTPPLKLTPHFLFLTPSGNDEGSVESWEERSFEGGKLERLRHLVWPRCPEDAAEWIQKNCARFT